MITKMNSKKFTLLSVGVLALVLLMSLTSATLTVTNIPTLTKNTGANTVNFTILSTVDEIVTFSANSITSSGKTITFTSPTAIYLVPNIPQVVALNYNIPSGFSFELGKEYSTTLTSTGTVSVPVSINTNLTFVDSGYCKYGDVGDLDIAKLTVSNKGSFGDDESWYPLGDVEVSVKVENNGNDKVKDIVVAWCLYDNTDKKCILDDEEKSFDLNDGSSKTVTFTMSLNPDDLNPDSEDYTLYVKAYSDDVGENTQCATDSETETINMDTDFVILTDINVPETVQCGSDVQVSANVWNMGTDDQEDVYVNIYNKDLNLDQDVIIGSVDSFNSEDLSATINIPEKVTEKTYNLILSVYDSNDDLYQNSNDDKSEFTLSLKVEGNCFVQPTAIVSASLESGAVAGKPVTVKATVTNTATKSQLITYNLRLTGYDTWASSATIDTSTLALNAGESKSVLVTVNPNKDVSGDQNFNIIVSTSGQDIVTQPVQVAVEKSGFNLGITGNIINSDNWYLWGIGALNVILVIIIILVAIKVAKS